MIVAISWGVITFLMPGSNCVLYPSLLYYNDKFEDCEVMCKLSWIWQEKPAWVIMYGSESIE